MRLINVSNRLPITVRQDKDQYHLENSVGGVATGIAAFLNNWQRSDRSWYWVGWPGIAVPPAAEDELQQALMRQNYLPVMLDNEAINQFYYGFCNETLWPLFHHFPLQTQFDEQKWQTYRTVNQKYCDQIVKIAKKGDIIWIQDYHFLLLPKLLKEKLKDNAIGFFLHIPFPGSENLRNLPKDCREEIIESLSYADLIGFHIEKYRMNFYEALADTCSFKKNRNILQIGDRTIKAGTFPMSIDFEYIHHNLVQPSADNNIIGQTKTILSVDRLDYTKGIVDRIKSYELFLEQHPQWQQKVKLILIVAPSRSGIKQYDDMKREIDENIGRINGRFGSVNWTPIKYQYRAFSFNELITLYRQCDVMLVTPLCDGMNLIAKEFIAARKDQQGVLVLSELAGAAQELTEAIQVCPKCHQQVATAIKSALEMPVPEQKKRMQAMQTQLKKYNILDWGNDFISQLQYTASPDCKEKAYNLSHEKYPPTHHHY